MTEVRETILRVRKLADGQLEFEDWRGQVQRCSVSELGSRVDQALADPNLPKVDVVSPGVNQMVQVYAHRLMPPELRAFAVPGFQLAQEAFRFWQGYRVRQAEAQYYEAARNQAQAHADAQASRSEPHRTVHRRGRRVG